MAQLLRGVEVEVLPRLLLDVGDHLVDLRAELAGLLSEDGGVDEEAPALHGGEHGQERHLDHGEKVVRPVLDELRIERPAEGAHRDGVYRRLGSLVGRLGERVSHVSAVEPRRGEVSLVGVEQIAGHARVEDAGRVDLGGVEGGLLGGVHGIHDVEQRLDVVRYDATRTEEADERSHARVALHPEKPSLAGEPHHVGLLAIEERLLALALVGTLERRAHPLAGRDRRVECLLGVGALERRRQGHASRGHLGGDRPAFAETDEAARHAREAERGEGARDLGRVEGRELGVVEVEVDRGVGAYGGDLAREQRVVHMGAEVLAHLALDLVGVRDDLVERAVLHDEGGRLLGADAGNAGDVVGGVALETVEVGHELGPDAVIEVVHALGGHDRDVGDALLGRDDLHVVGGQLVHVSVAREEEHLVALVLAATRERAENVIALPALALAHGHVERAEKVLHHGELLVEFGVHGRALRLVLREHLHADERLALVEGADHAIGLERLHELDEHVEEAEERIGRTPVRCAHGLHDRVVGAVHEGVAVDDGYGPRGLLDSFVLFHDGSFRVRCLS